MSGETTEHVQLVEFLRLRPEFITVAFEVLTHNAPKHFRAVERQYLRTVQETGDPRAKAGLAQMSVAQFWALTLQPTAGARTCTIEEWEARLSGSFAALDLRTPPKPDPSIEQMRARYAGVTV